jgi:iron complex outermembrane receptor protein
MWIFSIVSSALAGDTSCLYTLKGQILSEQGKPLEFSTIEEIRGRFSSVADRDGFFEIKNLCAGTYQFHIKHLICEHLDIAFLITQDTFIRIHLPSVSHPLQGVTVTGQSNSGMGLDDKISGDKLVQMQSNGIGAIMALLPGVSTLSSGGGIEKPVINGMYGYRTLIIQNGVRQEGQNWGQEHAPEIDPFTAKEVLLIKGPRALVYGTEGIGGVVLVQPASLFNYQKNEVAGSFYTGYHHNGRMPVGALQLGGRLFTKTPLYWRVQGSAKQQGNLRAPQYYLDNTGRSEQNMAWALGTHKGRFTAELSYNLFLSSFGIYAGAHIGNLSDLKARIEGRVKPIDNGFSYTIAAPRQEVLHETTRFKLFYKWREHRYLKAVFARQYNQRKEFDLHLGSNDNTPQFDYRISTHTLDLLLESEGKKGRSYQLGVQGMQQANTYSGRFFIPNFLHHGAGAFYYMQQEKARWDWSLAIRSDFRSLQSYYYVTRDSLATPTLRFADLSGSLGMHYKLSKRSVGHATIGRLWRPPMPNELYSQGMHHGAASYEMGNPDLQQEVSYKGEIGLEHQQDEKLKIGLNGYIQRVNGFINLVPSPEPIATIRGAFPFFQYEQTDAQFLGIHQIVQWKPSSHWMLTQKSELLWAHDRKRQTYLAQVPPFSFLVLAERRWKKNSLGMHSRMVARQFRYQEGSDLLAPPPSYLLIGAEWKGSFQFQKKEITYFLKVDNLLNAAYRDYMDRFRYFTDRPGRNIQIGFKYEL